MRRLRWISVALWIAGAAGLVEAADPLRQPRVGMLVNTPEQTSPADSWVKAFRSSLDERGWTDGKGLTILWKAAGRDEIPGVLDEFIGMPVDLLVVRSSFAAVEARKRTRSIPIIVRDAFYPVDAGLAQSLSRPGANVTGTTANSEGIEVNGKQLAFLKEIAPKVSRVVYLTSPLPVNEDRFAAGGVDSSGIPNRTVSAARALGISLTRIAVDPGDSLPALKATLSEAVARGMNGLFVDTPLHPQAIAAFAEERKLPAVYTFESGFVAGGLMYYGPTTNDSARQVASFVDKILKGAKAGDLPFESPAALRLLINANAARSIGLAVPASMLMQADLVIR